MIVEASQVRRRKQHYSRDRNKIFLRQLCEQNDSGIWVVKVNTELLIQNYERLKIFMRSCNITVCFIVIGKCFGKIWN